MTIDEATAQVSSRDAVIAALVKKYGPFTLQPHTEYFWELVSTIISQQISTAAAKTIEQRFVELFDGKRPTPEQVLAKKPDELRAAGLSDAKASYILEVANRVVDGRLQLEKLPELSNYEIIKELTSIKGIGMWSAHMFLIFALVRLDVLPRDDLGLRLGVQKAYNIDHTPTVEEVVQLAEIQHWHPYETIATWYLWRVLNDKPTTEVEQVPITASPPPA